MSEDKDIKTKVRDLATVNFSITISSFPAPVVVILKAPS